MNHSLDKEKSRLKLVSEKLPGLLLAIMIALLGKYLANWIPNIGGVTVAILLGMIIGNIFNLGDSYTLGLRFAEKEILSLAIMLMGLKLELAVIGELGLSIIIIIVIMVFSAIVMGIVFGRLLGLSSSFSILLGVGNGICGSSAIAAVAPIVSKEEEEIGLSIGVVNLLGTIGIFLLPLLVHLLRLEEVSSSLMIGGTLQAVGQVVAAGFSLNEEIGRLATVIKMGRILMLAPVVLLVTLSNRTNNSNFKSKLSLPIFIIGFFIFSLLGSFGIFPKTMSNYLKSLSKLLLIIAMAGVGLKIRLSSLLKQGPKALLVGGFIFLGQIVLIVFLIKSIL
ncbi:YeiH family protein [Orenia metallireducens]|nr:putative sulfate exporter family transporter [Orenia metallireducens]